MTATTQLTAEALKAATTADDAKSESAHTTTSSSLKRKRGNELKFYAVKAGHKPDIYHSWEDCKFQVTGFKGAVYKSFTSLTEAEAFMKSNGSAPASNATPKKFYAVQNGRKPGVYTDWPSAQEQIKGWTKPKHRSFTTRAEAEAFVNQGTIEGSAAASRDGDASSARETDSPVPKKAKTAKAKAVVPVVDSGPIDPGWAPLPPDAEDGFDRRQIMDPVTGQLRWKTDGELNAKKAVSKGDNFAEPLQIWTDGACRGNGKVGAYAGVGVYFGRNDPRNLAEGLVGDRQTNQRAELTAILRALKICPINRSTHIFSDSNYSINCVTQWFQKWQKNDWVTAGGNKVENKDIIKDILEIIGLRDQAGVRTKFEWVKGHGSNEGNVEADKLAVAGAEKAKRDAIAAVVAERGGDQKVVL